MDEKGDEEKRNRNISYKKKSGLCSPLFLLWYLSCDYTNIIINKIIASQVRKHQELSSLNNIAKINGNHISTNNMAHTIARNILTSSSRSKELDKVKY